MNTPGMTTFTIPDGFTMLRIQAAGAQGSSNTNENGVKGAFMDAYMRVVSNQKIFFIVGGVGDGDMPYNNAFSSMSGGGATEVYLGNVSLSNRMLVVGGGSGAGYFGGDGGGWSGSLNARGASYVDSSNVIVLSHLPNYQSGHGFINITVVDTTAIST
jgi:hypothetical protein